MKCLVQEFSCDGGGGYGGGGVYLLMLVCVSVCACVGGELHYLVNPRQFKDYPWVLLRAQQTRPRSLGSGKPHFQAMLFNVSCAGSMALSPAPSCEFQ